MKIIGKTSDELSLMPIDFYSIGHILLGYISYLISYLITYIFNVPNPIEYALISTIIVGILWELIENGELTKLKNFKPVKDSLENSLFDILFCFTGGIAGAILSYSGTDHLIVGSVYIIITIYIAYDVCKVLTRNNDKKEDNNA